MYQTLYRKYRPKKFEEVYDQKVIVKTLKNAIKTGRISHANMFVGPRGTGKTSIAKIFSRAINCEKNIDGDLCGKCFACTVSMQQECLDIIEIDAASNNGVDEIRELRDKVNLVPNSLKYKVYIIDEVHMLTVQAFNALLKTLEEPPEHAIFILATTDPQKVPETVVSRCQCYNFNRISNRDIILNLRRICDLENVQCDDNVLNEIAVLSNGGMRDSIGMLDKLISYSIDNITLDDFYEVNNMVSQNERLYFVSLLFDGNINEMLCVLENWYSDGVSIVQIMIKLLDDLKNIIVDFYVNGIEVKVEQYEKLAVFINDNLEKMKRSSNSKIFIEIILLKYVNEYINKTYNELDNNHKIISQEIISENISQENKINTENENISREIKNKNISENDFEVNSIRINNALATADKNELQIDKNKLLKLNEFVFDQKIGYLVCALLDGKIVVSSKDYILFSFEYSSMLEDNYPRLEKLSYVLKNVADINKKMAMVTDEEWSSLKNEYINKLKNGETYIIMDEFDLSKSNSVLKTEDKSVIMDDVTGIFGDIVEIN